MQRVRHGCGNCGIVVTAKTETRSAARSDAAATSTHECQQRHVLKLLNPTPVSVAAIIESYTATTLNLGLNPP
jgi:hypothetical protein